MLEQICEHLNNYFIESVAKGRYTIEDGAISPVPSLKEGQRFWLRGSSLNDGVYTYHADDIKNDDDSESADLSAETFDGDICLMAVPKTVIKLAGSISDWMEQYGEAVNSPYQSESVIGVYSYTKASSGASGGDGTDTVNWQKQFASDLKRWRKISL